MSGSLTFYTKTAASLGLRIGGVDVYKTTGNNITTINVPGRIGQVIPVDYDLLLNNEIREYAAAIYLRAASNADVEEAMIKIRDWLLNHPGYQTLTDSYEPSVYRRAFFSGDLIPKRKGAGQNFEIPLRFSCDPRRYIANVPDTVMNMGAQGALTATITPPFQDGIGLYIPEAPKPLIKFEGGWANDPTTLTFTDSTYTEDYGHISFDGNIGTLYFDCETLNATSQPNGGVSLNSWITDAVGDLQLNKTVTYMKRDNVDSKITITPRWWVR